MRHPRRIRCSRQTAPVQCRPKAGGSGRAPSAGSCRNSTLKAAPRPESAGLKHLPRHPSSREFRRMNAPAETRKFEAEVAQVLHLVTHSLYSHKEIFLRELISNASDACDKLRFEAIANPELMAGDTELHIDVSWDDEGAHHHHSRQRHRHDPRRSRRQHRHHRQLRYPALPRSDVRRPEGRRAADRPVRRGLLLRLRRRRQGHRDSPAAPTRRRPRA